MVTFILLPGGHPASAKPVLDAIRKVLSGNVIELDGAEPEKLETALKSLPKNEKFILIGKSRGGRVALEYQRDAHKASALILLAPAAFMDIKLKKISVPCLIIHGTADTTIPLTNSKELLKYLKLGDLVEVEGANHGYEGKTDVVAAEVKKWLEKVH
jgi:pimeloyl-ACP methyl ester carboxylesterase